jgi:hypothetical protein
MAIRALFHPLGRRLRAGVLTGLGAAALLVPLGGSGAAALTTDDAAPPTVITTHCGARTDVLNYRSSPRFDPLTATNAQLDANGLPHRPTGAADLAVWRHYVTSKRKTATCPVSTGRRIGPAGTSAGAKSATKAATSGSSEKVANWAGYELTEEHHTYTYAKGKWKIPWPSTPGTKKYYSCDWVGIGQGNSKKHPLVQAGSESDSNISPGMDRYYIWWEVFPLNNQQKVSAITTNSKNDDVYVSVSFTTNHAVMKVIDETTGSGGTYTYKTGSFKPDTSAEWIYERTGEGDYYPWLAPATTHFTDAYAKYGSTEKALGKFPHIADDMWNCVGDKKEELAYPGKLNSSGNAFTTYGKHPGSEHKKKTCVSP